MNESLSSTRRRSKIKLPMPGMAFWLFTIIGVILGCNFEEYGMWMIFGMAVGLGMDIAVKSRHST